MPLPKQIEQMRQRGGFRSVADVTLIETVLRERHGKKPYERVDPRPMEAMTALAVGLSGDKSLFDDLNTREQRQRVVLALQEEAVKRQQTLQQLLSKHYPEQYDLTSIHPAFKADLKRCDEQWTRLNPTSEVSPFQFRREQQPGHSILSSGPAVDYYTGAPNGGYKPPVDPGAKNVQAANWRDTISASRVRVEGDSLKLREQDGRHTDDKIRDLIITSELRWGAGKYHFHGSDTFIARASEILRDEGPKLRAIAEQQAREAAHLLQQMDPERFEALQAYPGPSNITHGPLDTGAIKKAEAEAEKAREAAALDAEKSAEQQAKEPEKSVETEAEKAVEQPEKQQEAEAKKEEPKPAKPAPKPAEAEAEAEDDLELE